MSKFINKMMRLIVKSLPKGLLDHDIKSLLTETYRELVTYFETCRPELMYILTCALLLFGSVGFICYYCGRRKTKASMVEANNLAREVHIISGTINPSPALVQRCKDIIENCDYLVNQPIKPYGFTPFLRACYSGNTELVKYMLSKGADIHSQTTGKDSAIYLAAYRLCKAKSTVWNSDILDVLFKAGCNLDVMKPTGHTVLHLAARYGYPSLVRWLLIHGANPNIRSKNPQAQTPYEIARDYNHQTIAALLHVYIPLVPKYNSSPISPILQNVKTSTPNSKVKK